MRERERRGVCLSDDGDDGDHNSFAWRRVGNKETTDQRGKEGYSKPSRGGSREWRGIGKIWKTSEKKGGGAAVVVVGAMGWDGDVTMIRVKRKNDHWHWLYAYSVFNGDCYGIPNAMESIFYGSRGTRTWTGGGILTRTIRHDE
ncbi:hypothetical protein FRC20_000626 [Serendipita sp. 405]|nr:hypothetical protein FRC20_000626 [Serendipita sp. 405]